MSFCFLNQDHISTIMLSISDNWNNSRKLVTVSILIILAIKKKMQTNCLKIISGIGNICTF